MKYFIFRNNTLEHIFGTEDVQYSGYEDISNIPLDVQEYLWVYQVPIKWEQSQLAAEIEVYTEKLQLVFSQIPVEKNFVVMTLVDVFPTRITDADFSVREAVAQYNAKLRELTRANANFKVIDFSEFTSRYNSEELIAWKFYFISHMYLSPKVVQEFKNWFEAKMKSIAFKRKKCIVLDLDNTLWGGVLGEDGIDGIKVDGDYPGKAFHYYQEALLTLSQQGVILTICSKNNKIDVLEAWEKNPFIVLKKENFAATRINWQDKATNIVELSIELNIGLDSMVFIDDNPTERELVKQQLPMVAVPEFPKQPYGLLQFFQQMVRDYFMIYDITDEDRKKTLQYKANAERAQEQAKFRNFEDFLRSIAINIDILKANKFNIPRIAQMTQKTNQFNLTTKRYTDSDIRGFVDAKWKIYCISVSDKFGDNGITGTIFINGSEIDELLLSCRILGKGIEVVFLKKVFQMLLADGITNLVAEYLPTKKNPLVSDFYEKLGFTCVSESENGSKKYEADLASLDLNIPDYYTILIK